MHKIIHDRFPFLFTFGAAQTTITVPINNNGEVKAVAIGTPQFTNAVTAKAIITDPLTGPGLALTGLSVPLFTSQAVANNTGLALVAGEDITVGEKGAVLIDKTYTLTVTLSGVPGAVVAGIPGSSIDGVLVVLYIKH
jgi:hypothetical protein